MYRVGLMPGLSLEVRDDILAATARYCRNNIDPPYRVGVTTTNSMLLHFVLILQQFPTSLTLMGFQASSLE